MAKRGYSLYFVSTKVKKLEKKLARIESELRQKDNDTNLYAGPF